MSVHSRDHEEYEDLNSKRFDLYNSWLNQQKFRENLFDISRLDFRDQTHCFRIFHELVFRFHLSSPLEAAGWKASHRGGIAYGHRRMGSLGRA